MNTNRQWLLSKRPQGIVGRDNFEYTETPIPAPEEGQVLVRNLFLSFDPTQRGWMEDRESYLPPVGLGEPMRAGSIGQVADSMHPGLRQRGYCSNNRRLAGLHIVFTQRWPNGPDEGARGYTP